MAVKLLSLSALMESFDFTYHLSAGNPQICILGPHYSVGHQNHISTHLDLVPCLPRQPRPRQAPLAGCAPFTAALFTSLQIFPASGLLYMPSPLPGAVSHSSSPASSFFRSWLRHYLLKVIFLDLLCLSSSAIAPCLFP